MGKVGQQQRIWRERWHISLGSTGLIIEKMVGALPSRVDTETAVKILRRAFEVGSTFDTARPINKKSWEKPLPECGIRL